MGPDKHIAKTVAKCNPYALLMSWLPDVSSQSANFYNVAVKDMRWVFGDADTLRGLMVYSFSKVLYKLATKIVLKLMYDSISVDVQLLLLH